MVLLEDFGTIFGFMAQPPHRGFAMILPLLEDRRDWAMSERCFVECPPDQVQLGWLPPPTCALGPLPHTSLCRPFPEHCMGDRFLSSAGAGGNCARPMRLPDPSPVLDKNRAPMGPEILSSVGAGVWWRLLWHCKTPVLYWINFSLRLQIQKPGNHPSNSRNFRGILGATLRMALTTYFMWKPYSRSNSRSDSRNWLDAKISAQILGAFYFKIGVVPAHETNRASSGGWKREWEDGEGIMAVAWGKGPPVAMGG